MGNSRSKAKAPSEAVRDAIGILKTEALAYPGAWEDHPWGEIAIKVRKKVFVFLWAHDGGLAVSLKLPDSAEEALLLPFTRSTGDFLAKSGWVTAKWSGAEPIPASLVIPWIEESYRAIAPKTLVKQLDAE